jgi:ATP-binding cassette subfamily F protein 3
MIDRELYGLLGRFLFTAQDAKKRIRDLSGGEKARVQMVKLMLSGANFLLLDEPTNHLDIQSAELLEEALEDYDGTLLVISHDRYFLDDVVNRIIELEGGTTAEYLGNYTYYAERKTRPNHGEIPSWPSQTDGEEKHFAGTGKRKSKKRLLGSK